MSLIKNDDPDWTSFSDFKNDNKIQFPTLICFQNGFYYYPHLVAMRLTSDLYTVKLTVDVRKPWMNYVNNGLKQIFDYWSHYLL